MRRSPRKASQTARAAACSSGSVDLVDSDRAEGRVRRHEEHAGHGRSHAQLDDGLAPVPREEERARHECEREDEQQDREHLNTLGDIRECGAQTADVPLDQLHPLGRAELAGDLRAHLLKRGREHRPHVGNRERDGVLVALEERAVYIAHGFPE